MKLANSLTPSRASPPTNTAPRRNTGENFLDKNKPNNVFDSLFFHCVSTALLVYAIAIPFFRVDYTSLPLTVGILAGLMWVPHSWIIQHWVGIFHTVARTALVTAASYLAPHHRFVVIPAVIVGVYGSRSSSRNSAGAPSEAASVQPLRHESRAEDGYARGYDG